MNNFTRWFTAGARNAAPQVKNTIAPMIAFQNTAIANWSAGDFASLSSEGFMRNPVVYRCVRMICESAASLPWLLYQGETELEKHPVLDVLNKPNSRHAGQEFMEALYGHLMISGNAFVRQVSLDDGPRELHLLRPDQVQVVSDNAGWPIAYEHDTGSHKQRFEIGEGSVPVLHLRVFNPLDELRGMSPLRAANMALNIHNAASNWNKALLDNSARPSGALVYTSSDAPNLSEDHFERLKKELEDGYTGASRAGRPMLLEGGLDWKAMGYSPKDMDFIEAKNSASRDIALAFGVPPMLLGIPGDNTYSNFQEANKSFWRQMILPLVGRTSGALGNWLGALYDGELRLAVDHDKVDALAGDRETLWQRVQAADFLSRDEKRAAVGYTPDGQRDEA